MERAAVAIEIGYVPSRDASVRLGLQREFVVALGDLPLWACMAGFDRWVSSHSRAPSPAEIRSQAERVLKPYHDEIAKREARNHAPLAGLPRCSAEAAARIMAENGFADAEPEAAPIEDHEWSKPSKAALAAARAANPAIQATLAHVSLKGQARQASEAEHQEGDA